MRDRGFDAAPIDGAIEEVVHGDDLARTPLGGQKRALRTFGERAPIEVGDLRRAIDELRPDVQLVDINCWGCARSRRGVGRPLGLVVPISTAVAVA